MRNLNVQLENIIEDSARHDINAVFVLTKSTNDINELTLKLLAYKDNFKEIIFGLSGNHIGVSYSNGARILLITK